MNPICVEIVILVYCKFIMCSCGFMRVKKSIENLGAFNYKLMVELGPRMTKSVVF